MLLGCTLNRANTYQRVHPCKLKTKEKCNEKLTRAAEMLLGKHNTALTATELGRVQGLDKLQHRTTLTLM